MTNKKFIVGIVMVLGVAVIVLLVIWIVSRINVTTTKTNQYGIENDISAVSLETKPIIEPVGMNIGFRVPRTLYARFDNTAYSAYFSNDPNFEIEKDGVYVIEMHGRMVLPSGSSLPEYLLGNIVSSKASVEQLGKTIGGYEMYRLTDISLAAKNGVAYAVDHGNGEFSFWLSEQYSELPVLEEMVYTVSPKIQP